MQLVSLHTTAVAKNKDRTRSAGATDKVPQHELALNTGRLDRNHENKDAEWDGCLSNQTCYDGFPHDAAGIRCLLCFKFSLALRLCLSPWISWHNDSVSPAGLPKISDASGWIAQKTTN